MQSAAYSKEKRAEAEIILHAFLDELSKIAVVVPIEKIAASASEKAQAHFDKPNWGRFEKLLSSKAFVKAVSDSPQADEKLRAYVKNVGDLKRSKEVVAVMPSRTSHGTYQIRRLPSGRLGCTCKDWQYKHSHKGTDCGHIIALQNANKMKTSSATLWNALRRYNQGKSDIERAEAMEANTEALRVGAPLRPVPKKRLML